MAVYSEFPDIYERIKKKSESFSNSSFHSGYSSSSNCRGEVRDSSSQFEQQILENSPVNEQLASSSRSLDSLEAKELIQQHISNPVQRPQATPTPSASVAATKVISFKPETPAPISFTFTKETVFPKPVEISQLSILRQQYQQQHQQQQQQQQGQQLQQRPESRRGDAGPTPFLRGRVQRE